MSRRWVGATILLGLLFVGCGSSRDGDAVVANIGDLGHVHDIVVDGSDVFLAAHSGLFRVEGRSRAVLIGDFRHDFMSMDAGPDGLVASGHPDLRFDEWRVDDKPAHLGFVTSTDAGGSWAPVALLGEVDFHSLTSGGDGTFYGADSSGVILASADGQAWDQRSTRDATDLSASPSEPESLLAVDGESGLVSLSYARGPGSPLRRRRRAVRVALRPSGSTWYLTDARSRRHRDLSSDGRPTERHRSRGITSSVRRSKVACDSGAASR